MFLKKRGRKKVFVCCLRGKKLMNVLSAKCHSIACKIGAKNGVCKGEIQRQHDL